MITYKLGDKVIITDASGAAGVHVNYGQILTIKKKMNNNSC